MTNHCPCAKVLLLHASTIAIVVVTGSAALAQATQSLDPITVVATKTEERASESLAAVSTVRQDQLNQIMASKPSEVFFAVPGVWFQERADDPGTAINIRGLQDFGRVAVLIDGARQNFQRTGHNADGVFYMEPELLAEADVVRGPVANIYGSGAIGGVVSFRTKDVDDILKPGQQWGLLTNGEIGSNTFQGLVSSFAAARVNPNVEFMVGGTKRHKSDYRDGDGNTIPNTGYDVWTGITKLTLRPADGHRVKLGYIHYDSDYTSGQPFVGTSPPFTGIQASSIFGTEVHNDIANARWTYAKPDDRVFDVDGNVYWTRTTTDQVKLDGLPPAFGGIGNNGDTRNFTIDTVGIDLHNTSRFDTGPVRHALTYGVDGFRDKVDSSGFGVVFTPSGERTVSGAFLQLKSNVADWVEIISAARYDRYELSGGGVSTEGDRLSPKITVGLTPIAWITPYVTYAEGYRAPAVTETLVAGFHPVSFAPFLFIPNAGVQPEVGKNKEAGVNLRFNDIFTKGDALRAKANVFRNDVENYIDLVGLFFGQAGQGGVTCSYNIPASVPGSAQIPDCEQYQNVAQARLEGAEFESSYDSGDWFGGVSYSHVKGRNVDTGAPLAKIAPDSAAMTAGARIWDRRITVAVRWQHVWDKSADDIPVSSRGIPTYPPTDAYDLVNLYIGYQPNPDVLASFSIENLLNEDYARYLTYYPNPTSSSAAPIAFPQPGITFKAGLKIRFGEDFLKRGGVL
jgi:hemoglobin/transferrin/lactoferrin receptor protein